MFNFFMDIDSYEDRKVGRYEREDLKISTAEVSDCRQPYETAIFDEHYKKGDWMIVEHYDTIEEAKLGHDKWVNSMTSDNPPEEITGRAENSYGLTTAENQENPSGWRL